MLLAKVIILKVSELQVHIHDISIVILAQQKCGGRVIGQIMYVETPSKL